MAQVARFWSEKYQPANQMYQCPECPRDLKAKVSQSAKNPGRTFVSCSKDYGGCGLFCFIDEAPKYGGGGVKRVRSQGTNVIGPVANQPAVHEQRQAELCAEIASLRALVVEVSDYLKQ